MSRVVCHARTRPIKSLSMMKRIPQSNLGSIVAEAMQPVAHKGSSHAERSLDRRPYTRPRRLGSIVAEVIPPVAIGIVG